MKPIGAERSRAYDGGIEQIWLNERGVFRVNYFHNEFGTIRSNPFPQPQFLRFFRI